MCNRLLVFDPVYSRCVHAVKKRCWLAPIFISDEKERPSNKIKAPGSRNSPCLSTRLLFLFFSSTAAFSDFSLSLLFLVFFFVFFPSASSSFSLYQTFHFSLFIMFTKQRFGLVLAVSSLLYSRLHVNTALILLAASESTWYQIGEVWIDRPKYSASFLQQSSCSIICVGFILFAHTSWNLKLKFDLSLSLLLLLLLDWCLRSFQLPVDFCWRLHGGLDRCRLQ